MRGIGVIILVVLLLSSSFASNDTLNNSNSLELNASTLDNTTPPINLVGAYVSIDDMEIVVEDSQNITQKDVDEFTLALALQISRQYNISNEEALSIISDNTINTTVSNESVHNDTELSVIVSQNNSQLEFGQLRQGMAIIGQPVQWFQDIVVTNKGTEPFVSFDLRDYNDLIGETFFSQINGIGYILANDISNSSMVTFALESYNTTQITAVYETDPVYIESQCSKRTVLDLIPADATIVNSSIDLNTIISQSCILNYVTNSSLTYSNISIVLEDIIDLEIRTVYDVTNGVIVETENGVVII